MRDPRPAQSLEDVNRRAYDLQVIPPGFVHYPAFSDEQFATLTEVRILAKDAVRRHPDAVMMEVDVEGSDPLVYQVLVLKTVVRIDAVVAADVRQDTMALLPPTPSPTSKGGAQPLQQTPALGANYYLTSSQRIFAGLRTADPSITTAEIADIYDAMKVIWSKDDDNRQDPHSTVILGGLLPDTRPRP
jgi:hypothetical protein